MKPGALGLWLYAFKPDVQHLLFLGRRVAGACITAPLQPADRDHSIPARWCGWRRPSPEAVIMCASRAQNTHRDITAILAPKKLYGGKGGPPHRSQRPVTHQLAP